MDCMFTSALKSCSRTDMAIKNTQPFYFDDVFVAGGNNNVTADDFSVDDLLDFSDKDFKDGGGSEFIEEKSSLLVSSQHLRNSSDSSSFSETDDFGSFFAAELAVPADDLESLEWLSQFVDDSQSELSLLCPAGGFNTKTGGFVKKRVEPPVHEIRVPCLSLLVPRKPRSIRPKAHRRTWSASPSLTTESSSFSSSSSYGSSSMSPFIFANLVHDLELLSSVEKPPAKKRKKVSTVDGDSASDGSQGLRRCSHCQVQKTPQWRAGPLGPKTLCNACGVRFKSGRLFPEYRPACSPTFSQEMHSNSHRKVLEMRRKKEVPGQTESGLAHMVPSF